MGKKYEVILSSNSDEKIISDLEVNISDKTPDKQVSANEKIIVKIKIQQSDAYNFSTGNENALIEDILISGASGLEHYNKFSGYNPDDSISIPLSVSDYFVVVRFTSNNTTYKVDMKACNERNLDQIVSVSASGGNYQYVKFSRVAEGKYAIASDNTDEVTYRIYDSELNSVMFSGANNSGSFNIDGNTIFVGICAE